MIEGRNVPKTEALPLSAKESLAAVITRPLTPDNIDTYFDNALDEIIDITDKLTAQYTVQHTDANKLPKSELEDLAYKNAELQSVPEILQIISEKKEQLAEIDDFIQQRLSTLSQTIVPPDKAEPLKGGETPFEKHGVKGRLKALLYILKTEGLNLGEVELAQGQMRDSMIRKISYTSVLVPSIHRLVLVCDEEGNATFVFDTEKTEAMSLGTGNLLELTKENLSTRITQNPGLGRRLIYSTHWGERMRDSLYGDLVETSSKEEAPTVATDELDPWRGFFYAEDKKHYGSINAIAQKLGVDVEYVSPRTQGLPSRPVRNAGGPTRKGFAFEDLEFRAQSLSLPRVNLEGEWEGFFEVEGKHYGSKISIAKKLGISEATVGKLIEKSNLKIVQARDMTNKEIAMSSYEDIQALVEDWALSPTVEKSGEWKGFYEHQGRHFGSISRIAGKMNITRVVVDKLLEENPDSFESLSVRGEVGQPTTAFPYEKIKEKLPDYSSMPYVAESGEWKDFYEHQGEHYGSLTSIASFLNVHRKTVAGKLKGMNSIRKMDLRASSGHPIEAYSFEQVREIFNNNPSRGFKIES